MKTCANCEYFDGGGERLVKQAVMTSTPLLGDCHNRLSPRYQTYSNDTCVYWFPTEEQGQTTGELASKVRHAVRPPMPRSLRLAMIWWVCLLLLLLYILLSYRD